MKQERSVMLTWTAGGSICGQRATNQDRWTSDGTFMAVSDGVGGGLSGELAATVSIAESTRHAALALDNRRADAQGAVSAADIAVRRLQERPDLRSCAATITCALISQHLAVVSLTVSWLGDSPAWILRGNELNRLTRPHHRAAELALDGWISARDVDRHPAARELTRAAGVGPLVAPEAVSTHLQAGDRVLLASDGLTTSLSVAEIRERLAEASTPLQATAHLLEAATLAGADDNVTVCVTFAEASQDRGDPVWSRVTGPVRSAELTPPVNPDKASLERRDDQEIHTGTVGSVPGGERQVQRPTTHMAAPDLRRPPVTNQSLTDHLKRSRVSGARGQSHV